MTPSTRTPWRRLAARLTGLSLCALAGCPSETASTAGSEPDHASGSAASAWRTVKPDETVLRQLPMGPVRFVSIHHTETPIPDSVSEVQRLRNIQHFHQSERGWGDIAYHYLIGPSGTVYEGRSTRYASASGTVYLGAKQLENAGQTAMGHTAAPVPQGVKAPGVSAGHITVCFLGSYGAALPTEEARRAAVHLIARLLRENGLTPDAIRLHREVAHSDCPGQALYDWFRGPGRTVKGRGEAFDWLRTAEVNP